MADTQRTITALLALLADNTTRAISPQDIRDLVATLRHAHGEIAFDTQNATATTIANADEWTKVAGTTTLAVAHEMDMPANNRLRYTGAEPRVFHIAASVSFTSASNQQVVWIGIAKNGTVDLRNVAERKVGTGTDVGSTAIHWAISLSTNDYVEVFCLNDTSDGDLTFVRLNLFAMGMTS